MDSGPGWLPDPEDGDRERYWNGSDWTDRVRPAGKARSLRLPDHVPELQRALAGATADIDAVEDRLSTMFDRATGPVRPSETLTPPTPRDTDDPDGGHPVDIGVSSSERQDRADPVPAPSAPSSGQDDDDGDAFAELDAALAAEEAEQFEELGEAEETKKPRRRLFRRRS
jgi:hypothetical protein